MTTKPQLREIDFPDIEIIGECAFAGCSSLSSARISNVVQLDDNAFDSSGLISVFLPKVQLVGSAVFADCQNLQKIATSLNNKNILLTYDNQISDVGQVLITMPEGVVVWASIPNCPSHVVLPAQAKKLDQHVFDEVQTVQDIDLGAVSCICNYGAFVDCPKLSSVCLSGYDGVVLLEDLPYIGTQPFGNCLNPVKVIVLSSQLDAYAANQRWSNLVDDGSIIIVAAEQQS